MNAPAEALTHWSSQEIVSVSPLEKGENPARFRVETTEDVFVLRRHSNRSSAQSRAYEHALLRHLKGLDWPVAPPLPTPGGTDMVTTDDGTWSLHPHLAGAPAPDQPVFLQRKGALLALVQRDMALWDTPGQRPGYARVVDLATSLAHYDFPDFPALLEWWGREEPSRIEALKGFRQRNLLALHARGYDRLPDVVVYAGCLGEHVLFSGKDVTGLLGFGLAHRDARAVDIARSLVGDCAADEERVARWLSGYATFVEPAMTLYEAEVIPELMVANTIFDVAHHLAAAARGGTRGMLGAAFAGIDTLLPRLEASLEGLRSVLRGTARMKTA